MQPSQQGRYTFLACIALSGHSLVWCHSSFFFSSLSPCTPQCPDDRQGVWMACGDRPKRKGGKKIFPSSTSSRIGPGKELRSNILEIPQREGLAATLKKSVNLCNESRAGQKQLSNHRRFVLFAGLKKLMASSNFPLMYT